MQRQENKKIFLRGMQMGIPICLGYFAVSFTLGISAHNAGLTPWQATLTSLLVNASAGQYAGFTVIAAGAAYWEMLLMEFVANIRYLLMSCSLSQKLGSETGLLHRLIVGFAVTDEIFGVSVSVPDKLNPFYNYGLMAVALPGWALGTCLGVVLGNILPGNLVSALSVALYGMFIAIIIPPARKSRVIAVLIVISMVLSCLFEKLTEGTGLSAGIRTIILTVAIAGIASVVCPVKGGQPDEA